ncbi:bicyclomycin resistance protein [Ammoniphilus oxalaticus]|uniref:Bicyclomycin resistance protein n=1 Tax=Ammoniphilus oxalaticus TaxID=66863 RepID=A0A419SNJ8_9BACL|nr:MFS transporter [Ammoniphilus oxalaticus]RKD25855.1 bicyclomycin resistance protein [Ammoniphilus oxalaticus]
MTIFIYLIIMISFVDTFSQLPIMSPFAQSLGATPFFIGVVVGMYSLTNMVGNIFSGFWIDKEGTRRVLLFGLVASGLVLFAYAFVNTVPQLLVARFLHGLSGGILVPAAFTFLANRGDGAKRGKTMALSGAAVGLAAVIGPAFGGIVTSKFGIEWVFIVIGSLMIVTAGVTRWLLPHTPAQLTEVKQAGQQNTTSFVGLLKVLPLLYAYIGSFSLMFAQGVLAYMLPLKVEALNYGSALSGMLFGVFGITAIFIFILPTNRLFDRFPHEYTMTVGMVIIGAALFLLSMVTGQTVMYGIMMLYGTGFAFIFPSINALIVQHTSAENRGKAFAVFYALFSLGVVVGSFVTGVFDLSADTSFVVGSAVLIVNSIVIWTLSLLALKRESLV